MRNECARAIEEIALSDPKVVVVASDPSSDFMLELASKHPDRFMVEGVCEQALVGVSAGLASEGFYPYIVMVAVFGTRRCYEQLLLDFALHRVSGCMVGIGGGLTYALLGPTHIAVDDISLSASIPGSAILVPGDADEAVRLAKFARGYEGLSYLRLAGTTGRLEGVSGDVVFGSGRLISEPGEVLFISTGAATLFVQPAVARLRERGVDAGGIHLHTVRPLDERLVHRYARQAKVVICVEEHRKVGGLSSAILHSFAVADPPIRPERFVPIGVDDGFPTGYGAHEDLIGFYGIDSESLVSKAEEMLSMANLSN
jgi:transketolase